MTSIHAKAFVHRIDNQTKGFIYAVLKQDNVESYLRISSPDSESGIVQVISFQSEKGMIDEAQLQPRLNSNLVLADEQTIGIIAEGSKHMLIGVLLVQHEYLFLESTKTA